MDLELVGRRVVLDLGAGPLAEAVAAACLEEGALVSLARREDAPTEPLRRRLVRTHGLRIQALPAERDLAPAGWDAPAAGCVSLWRVDAEPPAWPEPGLSAYGPALVAVGIGPDARALDTFRSRVQAQSALEWRRANGIWLGPLADAEAVRPGDLPAIATWAAFLLSPRSAHFAGAVIEVDGGRPLAT